MLTELEQNIIRASGYLRLLNSSGFPTAEKAMRAVMTPGADVRAIADELVACTMHIAGAPIEALRKSRGVREG